MTSAKKAARRATGVGRLPQKHFHSAKTTLINTAKAERRKHRTLPEGFRKHLKKIDAAIPGRYTRKLYDALGRNEACVLAQLWTGIARLNGYLHHIGAIDTDQYACGQARETVKHFLFNCSLWATHRDCLSEQIETRRRGSLLYYLGRKAASDLQNWRPTIKAVQTTIKYTIITGQLDREVEQTPASQATQQ
jgi:hypothetical protein